MQNNFAKVNYGENHYAPVANIDSNDSSTQIDTDAFNAQQAGSQVEGSSKKLYIVYEHSPEQQQVIQTVLKPKKPHYCGNCTECEERRKREKEERLQRERYECIGSCLIEFCCLVVCKALLNSR